MMINEFSRTEMLIGTEGMNKLKNSTVAVFGVGGVGSHAAEALARCGVGRLILVDNDTVSLTNINRQSIALHSTMGQFKTRVMKDKIADICPGTQVITFEEFVLPDNIESLFERMKHQMGQGSSVDYILDAIDTVTAKLALAGFAASHAVPVIASMGTGNKLHPELFRISDISQTPLQGNAQGTKSQEHQGTKGLLVAGTASYPRTDSGGYRVPPRHSRKHFFCTACGRTCYCRRNHKGYLRAGLAADIPLRFIMIHTGPIPGAPGKTCLQTAVSSAH